MIANLTEQLSVENLAKRAGMSTRNFARVFRQEMSITPAEFVDAARLDAARRLLEDTARPLQSIASECGFRNLDGMRRTFIRNLGVSPGGYRRCFRSAWVGAGRKSLALGHHLREPV